MLIGAKMVIQCDAQRCPATMDIFFPDSHKQTMMFAVVCAELLSAGWSLEEDEVAEKVLHYCERHVDPDTRQEDTPLPENGLEV